MDGGTDCGSGEGSRAEGRHRRVEAGHGVRGVLSKAGAELYLNGGQGKMEDGDAMQDTQWRAIAPLANAAVME